MSTHLIGQRLTQLRQELAGPEEKKWSQAQVAAAAGLTRNVVARLEQHGAGGIDMLQTLLTFYHERGYNPSWVLLADNSGVAKHRIGEGEKVITTKEAAEMIQALNASMQQQLDALISKLQVS